MSWILRTVLVCCVLSATSHASAEVRVIDGDTLELEGERFRIEGIDAPEQGQKCRDWACGKAATAHLIDLTSNARVVCQEGPDDGFGRQISSCTADGFDLGAAMVSAGLAWAFVRYSNTYVKEEAAARNQRIGIWSVDSQPAWEFRSAQWRVAEQQAPNGCPIKGNISKSGRIYHAPWSPWYNKTRVSPEKGERWFCSEAEALNAGWRAPIWGR